MVVRKINDDIFNVGVIDWNRRLFDELIPLPDGTTYNSYLIKGSEKTALIDTVDPAKKDELKANLDKAGVKNIDYIITHHAEQDHSGSIPFVLEWFPKAKVVTNDKCKNLLKELLLIADEKFMVVADREKLSLGNKTLEFIFTPWVHWPETFVTYLHEDNILFSCDFFGSHLAQSDLYAKDISKVYRSAKRYYAEIMMPFRISIKGHLEILKQYKIGMIAPSHGPVYLEPKLIMDAYADWTSDKVKNQVVIPYVSMHGSVQTMVNHLTSNLIDRGVEVELFNLPKTDIGELAMSLVDAATIVIGVPAVLAQAHPSAVYAAYLANALRPKTRFASVVGSYGWGSKMLETIVGLIPNLKVEVIPSVIVKGYPKSADFEMLISLAEQISDKHKLL